MSLRPTRVGVNIKSTYTLKGFSGEGNITDISTGGVGIEVKQIFVIGDLVRVSCRLPEMQDGDIDFWGIVRNVSGNVVGLKYEEISKDTMDKIDKYVGILILKAGRNNRENF
jgi:hypothetical protein